MNPDLFSSSRIDLDRAREPVRLNPGLLEEEKEFDGIGHFTPLMWAACEGNVDNCRILLELGSLINKQDSWVKISII